MHGVHQKNCSVEFRFTIEVNKNIHILKRLVMVLKNYSWKSRFHFILKYL